MATCRRTRAAISATGNLSTAAKMEGLPCVRRHPQTHPHLGGFQKLEVEGFLQLLRVRAGLDASNC